MRRLNFLGLKNYRAIKEYVFDFSSMTFLIGPNNSGKSSVTKAIELLKNNFEHPDFKTRNFDRLAFDSSIPSNGSFQSCLNENSKEKVIKFLLPFKLFDVTLNYETTFSLRDNSNSGLLNSMLIIDTTGDHEPTLVLEMSQTNDSDGDIVYAMKVNYNYLRNKYCEVWGRLNKEYNDININEPDTKYNNNTFDELLTNRGKKEGKDDLKREISKFNPNEPFFSFGPKMDKISDVSNYETIYLDLLSEKRISFTGRFWNDFMAFLSKKELAYESIYHDIQKFKKQNHIVSIHTTETGEKFFKKISETLDEAMDQLIRLFRQCTIIKSDKSLQKREYESSDNKNVFSNILKEYERQESEKDFTYVNNWMRKLKITNEDEKFIIEHPTLAISCPMIINDKTKIKRDLIDYGFGTTQLVMLLILFSTRSENSKIVFLEEPEINLHPNFQSHLADIFVDAMRMNKTQLVIETHSEYLIRKIQYLVGNKSVNGDFITIYYFNKEKNTISNLNINKDGTLSKDFDDGFYDESLRWQFELLRIQNPQKN